MIDDKLLLSFTLSRISSGYQEYSVVPKIGFNEPLVDLSGNDNALCLIMTLYMSCPP